MPKKRLYSGVIDPITIIGVLFLIATLAVGTYVASDRGLSLNINENAATNSCNLCLKNVDNPDECYPSPCGGGNDGGIIKPPPKCECGVKPGGGCKSCDEEEQPSNPAPPVIQTTAPPAIGCNADGTMYQNGAIIIGGSSGYSRCEGNSWVPCPTCTITQLTTVPPYLQSQYNQAVQEILIEQEIAEQTAPRPNNLAVQLSDNQQEQKDICLMDGGMWNSQSMSCTYVTPQLLQEQVQTIQNQRPRGEKRCSGSMAETWNGATWDQEYCSNGCINGLCITATKESIEVNRDDSGTTRDLTTITYSDEQIVTANTYSLNIYNNIEKVDEGFIRNFTSVLRDKDTNNIFSALTQSINTWEYNPVINSKPNYKILGYETLEECKNDWKMKLQSTISCEGYDISNTRNESSTPIYNNFAACNKEGMTDQEKENCSYQMSVAYNVPIVDRYIQSYANQEINYNYKRMGYDSVSACIEGETTIMRKQQCNGYIPSKEQFSSSVALGTTLTAGGAIIAATGGASTGAISITEAIGLGMAGMSTYQLGTTTDTCITEGYSDNCRTQLAWTLLSYANIGSSALQGAYQTSNVIGNANTFINVVNVVTDIVDISQSCGGGEYASGFGCGAAIVGTIFDVGQGASDFGLLSNAAGVFRDFNSQSGDLGAWSIPNNDFQKLTDVAPDAFGVNRPVNDPDNITGLLTGGNNSQQGNVINVDDGISQRNQVNQAMGIPPTRTSTVEDLIAHNNLGALPQADIGNAPYVPLPDSPILDAAGETLARIVNRFQEITGINPSFGNTGVGPQRLVSKTDVVTYSVLDGSGARRFSPDEPNSPIFDLKVSRDEPFTIKSDGNITIEGNTQTDILVGKNPLQINGKYVNPGEIVAIKPGDTITLSDNTKIKWVDGSPKAPNFEVITTQKYGVLGETQEIALNNLSDQENTFFHPGDEVYSPSSGQKFRIPETTINGKQVYMQVIIYDNAKQLGYAAPIPLQKTNILPNVASSYRVEFGTIEGDMFVPLKRGQAIFVNTTTDQLLTTHNPGLLERVFDNILTAFLLNPGSSAHKASQAYTKAVGAFGESGGGKFSIRANSAGNTPTTPLATRIGDWVNRTIGNNPITNFLLGRPEEISLKPDGVAINRVVDLSYNPTTPKQNNLQESSLINPEIYAVDNEGNKIIRSISTEEYDSIFKENISKQPNFIGAVESIDVANAYDSGKVNILDQITDSGNTKVTIVEYNGQRYVIKEPYDVGTFGIGGKLVQQNRASAGEIAFFENYGHTTNNIELNLANSQHLVDPNTGKVVTIQRFIDGRVPTEDEIKLIDKALFGSNLTLDDINVHRNFVVDQDGIFWLIDPEGILKLEGEIRENYFLRQVYGDNFPLVFKREPIEDDIFAEYKNRDLPKNGQSIESSKQDRLQDFETIENTKEYKFSKNGTFSLNQDGTVRLVSSSGNEHNLQIGVKNNDINATVFKDNQNNYYALRNSYLVEVVKLNQNDTIITNFIDRIKLFFSRSTNEKAYQETINQIFNSGRTNITASELTMVLINNGYHPYSINATLINDIQFDLTRDDHFITIVDDSTIIPAKYDIASAPPSGVWDWFGNIKANRIKSRMGLIDSDFIPISNFNSELSTRELELIRQLKNDGIDVYVLSENKINRPTGFSSIKIESYSNTLGIKGFPKKNSITISAFVLEDTPVRSQLTPILIHEKTHILGPQVPSFELLNVFRSQLNSVINENMANDMAYIYMVENNLPSNAISIQYAKSAPYYQLLLTEMADYEQLKNMPNEFAQFVKNSILSPSGVWDGVKNWWDESILNWRNWGGGGSPADDPVAVDLPEQNGISIEDKTTIAGLGVSEEDLQLFKRATELEVELGKPNGPYHYHTIDLKDLPSIINDRQLGKPNSSVMFTADIIEGGGRLLSNGLTDPAYQALVSRKLKPGRGIIVYDASILNNPGYKPQSADLRYPEVDKAPINQAKAIIVFPEDQDLVKQSLVDKGLNIQMVSQPEWQAYAYSDIRLPNDTIKDIDNSPSGVWDGVKKGWNNFVESDWNPLNWFIGGGSPATDPIAIELPESRISRHFTKTPIENPRMLLSKIEEYQKGVLNEFGLPHPNLRQTNPNLYYEQLMVVVEKYGIQIRSFDEIPEQFRNQAPSNSFYDDSWGTDSVYLKNPNSTNPEDLKKAVHEIQHALDYRFNDNKYPIEWKEYRAYMAEYNLDGIKNETDEELKRTLSFIFGDRSIAGSTRYYLNQEQITTMPWDKTISTSVDNSFNSFIVNDPITGTKKWTRDITPSIATDEYKEWLKGLNGTVKYGDPDLERGIESFKLYEDSSRELPLKSPNDTQEFEPVITGERVGLGASRNAILVTDHKNNVSWVMYGPTPTKTGGDGGSIQMIDPIIDDLSLPIEGLWEGAFRYYPIEDKLLMFPKGVLENMLGKYLGEMINDFASLYYPPRWIGEIMVSLERNRVSGFGNDLHSGNVVLVVWDKYPQAEGLTLPMIRFKPYLIGGKTIYLPGISWATTKILEMGIQ